MNWSTIKKIVIPEGVVKKIVCAGVVLWKAMTNWVPLSINADGKIYNNGLGYKNQYRVRSGGTEATVENYSPCACTGFIPAKGNDVVRVHTLGDFLLNSAMNAINVSDSSFTNLGQIAGNAPNGYGIFQNTALKDYKFDSVVKESENVYKWIVPPNQNIDYIRVTAVMPELNNTSQFIVTINEEITL